MFTMRRFSILAILLLTVLPVLSACAPAATPTQVAPSAVPTVQATPIPTAGALPTAGSFQPTETPMTAATATQAPTAAPTTTQVKKFVWATAEQPDTGPGR